MITNLFSNLNTNYELTKAQLLLKNLPVHSPLENLLKQSIETIAINIRWVNKNPQEINDWLLKYKDYYNF